MIARAIDKRHILQPISDILPLRRHMPKMRHRRVLSSFLLEVKEIGARLIDYFLFIVIIDGVFALSSESAFSILRGHKMLHWISFRVLRWFHRFFRQRLISPSFLDFAALTRAWLRSDFGASLYLPSTTLMTLHGRRYLLLFTLYWCEANISGAFSLRNLPLIRRCFQSFIPQPPRHAAAASVVSEGYFILALSASIAGQHTQFVYRISLRFQAHWFLRCRKTRRLPSHVIEAYTTPRWNIYFGRRRSISIILITLRMPLWARS